MPRHQNNKPAPREMYPLLQPNDNDSGFARAHAPKITIENAQSLMDSGLAAAILKNGKYAFKLLRATSPQNMDIRGRSCRMTGKQKANVANIFEDFTDGIHSAVETVAAWEINAHAFIPAASRRVVPNAVFSVENVYEYFGAKPALEELQVGETGHIVGAECPA